MLYSLQKKGIRIIFLSVNVVFILWFAIVLRELFLKVLRGDLGPFHGIAVEILYFFATLLAIFFFYKLCIWSPFRTILRKTHSWIFILLLAILSRFIWIYLYGDIELKSDFALYMNLAISVVKTGSIPPNYQWYVAFAPYVLGYVTFLSLLMSLLGTSLFVVQLANCVLSGLIAVLLFFIVRRITGKAEAGFLASAFWIVMPEVTGMTSFPHTETLFITLLLAAFYILLVASHNRSSSGWFLYIILAAFLVILMNEVRPLWTLIALALIGYSFTWLNLKRKTSIGYLAGIVLFVLLIYTSSTLVNKLKDSFLGLPVARNTFGYGLYLGLQDPNNGSQNPEAASPLEEATQNGLSAQAFHESMLAISKERIAELADQNRLIPLLANKIRTFWSHPNAFLDWVSETMPPNYYKRKILDILYNVSDFLYAAVIFYSMLGSLISPLYKNYRYQTQIFFVKLILIIYFIGMTFFDINGRYLIPVIPYILLLAVFGIHILFITTQPQAKGAQ